MEHYSLTDPEVYEDPTRYVGSPVYREHVRGLVPDHWDLKRSAIWLHAIPRNHRNQAQGFKVHVSSVLEHARDVLSAVVPVCVSMGASFKLAADPRILASLNSKNYDRGGGGKFMTLYPRDEAHFKALIEALHEATRDGGFNGPYILSDRRYRDSRILFYRYGGITPPATLRVDGTHEYALVGPDGSTMPDRRHPYFKLPDWVTDPFGGTAEVEENESPLLDDRFEIKAMVAVSNRGGVYDAIDRQTGENVILKEARPFINSMRHGTFSVDSTALLAREFEILQRLEHIGSTPRPIALFQQWEHTFLAQEKIEARVLRRFVAEEDHLVLPYILREGRLDEYLPKIRTIGIALLDLLEGVHAAGFLVGDLSQSNIMVDEDVTRIWLIDVESAVEMSDTDFMRISRDWFTPGFAPPDRMKREHLTPYDDFYAAGMLIYSLLMGGFSFFDLKPEGRHQFLAELGRLGVPSAFCQAVEALLDGRPEVAREELARLPERQVTPPEDLDLAIELAETAVA